MDDVTIPEKFRDEIRRAAAYRVNGACKAWGSIFSVDDDEAIADMRAQCEVIGDRIATMEALEAGATTLPEETYRSLLREAADRAAYAVSSAVEAAASPEHIAEMAILSRDLHAAEMEALAHA